MAAYTYADPRTGADIAFSVDWGMPGSRHYPAEAATVHGIEITLGGELIGPVETREILTRVSDADLIEVAEAEEMYRADDKGDHLLELQREAAQ